MTGYIKILQDHKKNDLCLKPNCLSWDAPWKIWWYSTKRKKIWGCITKECGFLIEKCGCSSKVGTTCTNFEWTGQKNLLIDDRILCIE